MTSYASQKGRSVPQAQAAPEAAEPITPDQEAAIEANKEFILEHMPEMLPIIRNMHAEGLISGWRNVKSCKLINANDHQ
jgi:hypothetical protein